MENGKLKIKNLKFSIINYQLSIFFRLFPHSSIFLTSLIQLL